MRNICKYTENKLIELYEKEVDENYGNIIQIFTDLDKKIDIEKLKKEVEQKKERFKFILTGK
jgi:hypothetical protein